MASTSVVLPWSTCATIATLRRSARPVTGSGRSGAVTDTQELQPEDGCGPSRLRGVIPPTGGHRGVSHHVGRDDLADPRRELGQVLPPDHVHGPRSRPLDAVVEATARGAPQLLHGVRVEPG